MDIRYFKRFLVIFEDKSERTYDVESFRELPDLIDEDNTILWADFSDVESIIYQGIVKVCVVKQFIEKV